MNNQEKQEEKQMTENVLGAIKSGEAKMRPRWHFVMRAALIMIGGIIVFLFTVYLVSFLMYILRETGVWVAPAFGFAGWRSFFISFPWILFIFSVIFAVILGILVKRYAFVYRHPLVYFLAGILLFVVATSLLVAQTSFHKGLYDFARRGELPVIGGVYRGLDMRRPPDINQGIVIQVLPGGFILKNMDGETSTIFFGPQTNLTSQTMLTAGSQVVVFGRRTASGTIEAMGIRSIGN